jgi:hypothetical protein
VLQQEIAKKVEIDWKNKTIFSLAWQNYFQGVTHAVEMMNFIAFQSSAVIHLPSFHELTPNF